jgi:peptidoglycan hydrolase-like protein with peptidoglycan-binding domain
MSPRRPIFLCLALSLTAGSNLFAASQTPTATAKKPAAKSAHHSSKKVSSRHKDKGQMAPTADRVSQIQEALAKNGSFANAPNGKWDESTVDAMKKFQGSHGLNPSGKLDALTLERLGLGSTTAGIAEPIAPPNSSSRLTGASQQPSRQ